MYPILFSFGRLNVYYHGLMMALGAIAGGLVIFYLAKRKNLETNFVLDLCIYTLLFGIIGSRILYVILYFDQFQRFREVFFIWYGGLVSYGGIAGGFLVAYLYLKAKKQPILKWFDIGIIGLLVGWAFGRIGCLLNGDSYGLISQSKLAIWGRMPTQIFESTWAIIAVVLCYLGLGFKAKKHLPDGIIFISGIGLYALGRFVIDFFRDESIIIWFLKGSQVGSLIIFILSFLAILYLIKYRKDNHGSF